MDTRLIHTFFLVLAESQLISVWKSGFPVYFSSEIQDFQGPCSCIFKDQLSMEVYSMYSITAIFNIYLCDYGTVLVDKKTKHDNY